MDHYLFNDNLSIKLNIIFYAFLNSNLIINEDHIPFLLKEYSEIKKFDEMKNFTKFLYFNMKTINKILYESDIIIQIQDYNYNDLSSNFYLILLIKAEEEIINYKYGINYINIFNKLKNNEENKYFNLINSKIIIELINNFKNCDLYDEDKDEEYISKLENENKEYIKNNLNILKEINLNINETDIYNKNIDELYVDIIIALIKSDKLIDLDLSFNIFKQLDLENIDIPFISSEILFKRMLEVLKIDNYYINQYIINNFDDLNDINKINFHYILLKFIFKSSFYLYHIPLLYEAHIIMIQILKSKEYFTFNVTNQIIIERIEYVIRKLCDSDYYFNSKYLIKKRKENNLYIKSNILKSSTCIFNISILTNKNPQVNKIECIYEENKKISFKEMIKLYDNSNEYEKKLELNLNYFLLLNLLSTYKNIIENQVNIFQFDYNFKLIFEFINENIKKDKVIYDLKVEYIVSEHPFFKTRLKSSDENILEKKNEELEGFISLMSKLNFQSSQKTRISTKISSNTGLELSNIYSSSLLYDTDKKNLSYIYESFIDENEYKIIQFENIIHIHEDSVKFFLCLKDEYYFSCNDKNMILYDRNFKKIVIINNLGHILYNISEKTSKNKNFIELIACYGQNIYLIIINKTNYKYETKKYQIPKTTILFCLEILNKFIIVGINNIMQIEDLFNDKIEVKKMIKISSKSYKRGLPLNNDYIALISNNLIPGGSNELIICNLITNEIDYQLSGYSFNLSDNSISLLKLKGGNILLCACKKYKLNEQNGFLVIELPNQRKMRYKFYNTGNTEVYCFCQLFENSNFFFAGCFDLDKRIGLVKLYKLNDNDGNGIKFLQNIEISEDDNNFKGFNFPVNNIIQIKYSGKIIITTIDGRIYLFSKSNLDYYLKKQKR